MIYNYNRLWKLLIDKGMTKTQMRKAAGISTNILAKMGKGEPVAMDSLAKIATALQCGLDDIVEIQKEGEKRRQIKSWHPRRMLKKMNFIPNMRIYKER